MTLKYTQKYGYFGDGGSKAIEFTKCFGYSFGSVWMRTGIGLAGRTKKGALLDALLLLCISNLSIGNVQP